MTEIDLHCGRWEDVLGDVECDALITDPPYGARTHEGQRHGRRDGAQWVATEQRWASSRGISYDHFAPTDVDAFVESWSPRVRGWFCAFTSHDLIPSYCTALERAGRYVFAPIACVQRGMNVRLAGDGPSNWTTWLVVSRPTSLHRWGTLPGAYVGNPFDTGENTATAGRRSSVVGSKPVWLMRALVRDYSRPGDLVCDPCAGGGTTLLAAAIEGRRAVGAEMDPAHFAIAQKRLARGYTPTLSFRRTSQGADTMPRQKKIDTETPSLPLPAELAAVAEKYRKALAPLADREQKLVAELADVREQRLAIEECLHPLEKVIADQRSRADAARAVAADATDACAVSNAVIAAEMTTHKVGDAIGIGA